MQMTLFKRKHMLVARLAMCIVQMQTRTVRPQTLIIYVFKCKYTTVQYMYAGDIRSFKHTYTLQHTQHMSATVKLKKVKNTQEVEESYISASWSCYWSGMMESTAGCKSTVQRDRKNERERQPKNGSIDEKDRSLWSILFSSKFSFDFRLLPL